MSNDAESAGLTHRLIAGMFLALGIAFAVLIPGLLYNGHYSKILVAGSASAVLLLAGRGYYGHR